MPLRKWKPVTILPPPFKFRMVFECIRDSCFYLSFVETVLHMVFENESDNKYSTLLEHSTLEMVIKPQLLICSSIFPAYNLFEKALVY